MAGSGTPGDTIETRIPARLDRLPWARFHWLIVIGLGTVWILDGLEVTIVGAIASRLTEPGSGIKLDPSKIGTAAAFYVGGACIGALFFGQLTDRFGRKKLFLITLTLYLVATAATAFSFAPWYLYMTRFFTGAGIGGEYAAINSAIDELIPARVRGRVDLIINGSYWLGAAVGSVAALFFLDTSIFATNVGWRLAFGVGVVFGLAILFVRRNLPESPRWLFIHGREQEAEEIVGEIEQEVRRDTGQELEEPDDSIVVRQRKTIPFRMIARTAFRDHRQRTVLGFALFIGQAFIYNAVTFDLGTLISRFFGVSSGSVPYWFAVFAVGNFLGPLTLGRLFDTVGRRPMVSLCYLGSAAMLGLTAILFVGNGLTIGWFMLLIGVTFFIASAGASSAYLTGAEATRAGRQAADGGRGGGCGRPAQARRGRRRRRAPRGALPARPGHRLGRLLPGHVGGDPVAGRADGPRSRRDRACAGAERPHRSQRAGAPRGSALLGPRPLPECDRRGAAGASHPPR